MKNKLILFIICIMLLLIPSLVNASMIISNSPEDGSHNTTYNPDFRVATTISNSNLTSSITNVVLNMTFNSSYLSANGSNVVNMGEIVKFPNQGYMETYMWNLSCTQAGDYKVIINSTDDQGHRESVSFVLTFYPDNLPSLQLNTQDATTLAEEQFNIPVTLFNNGSASQPEFNVSLTYNNSLFEFISSSANNCADSAEGGYNIAYCNVTSLASNSTLNINFTFNSTLDKGYIYNDKIYGDAYGKKAYPVVTVNPRPTYELNVTNLYNQTSGTLGITTDNQTIAVPVSIRNIGNQDLTGVTLIVKANGTNFQEIPDSVGNLAAYVQSSGIYYYRFPGEGIYNVTAITSGSNGALANDSKLFDISFSFSDSDGDGYFPIANGGIDCDDSQNDSSYIVGASCTRSGYTGATYSESGNTCACTGGNEVGGGGSGGSSSTTTTTYSASFSSSGDTKTLDEDDKIRFSFDGETYTIELDSVEGSYSRITIDGSSKRVDHGVETKFDINDNGKFDLSIMITRVDGDTAKIFFKNIESPEEEPVEEEDKPDDIDESEEEPDAVPVEEEDGPMKITLTDELQNVVLGKGDIVVFKLKGEYHGITIKSIKENSAVIIVASDPVVFELQEGDSNEVDVDADKKEDLYVGLKEVRDGEVVISVKSIEKKSSFGIGSGWDIFGTGGAAAYITLIVAAIMVIILGVLLFRASGKENKPKKKR